jgi:peptidoglycan hydrolase CwlO-like protein
MMSIQQEITNLKRKIQMLASRAKEQWKHGENVLKYEKEIDALKHRIAELTAKIK